MGKQRTGDCLVRGASGLRDTALATGVGSEGSCVEVCGLPQSQPWNLCCENRVRAALRLPEITQHLLEGPGGKRIPQHLVRQQDLLVSRSSLPW